MTPQDKLNSLANAERAINSARYFKTGPGQYGEGDIFIGVTVPNCRLVAKEYTNISINDTLNLLHSPIHEYRLTALFIFINKYKSSSSVIKNEIYDIYLSNTKFINNWDLVDCSAHIIVGPQLGVNNYSMLSKLSRSKSIWERRIAILACFYTIKQKNPDPAFRILEILINDQEDLIQKANGWMLREIGKNCSRDILVNWLLTDLRYKTIPRTTLRYAIEHFSYDDRQKYLKSEV